MTEAGQNRRILVLSDMHLGRDCNEITGFNRSARPDSAFDRAFIDMLDFYTRDRETEWRLVLAGDFSKDFESLGSKTRRRRPPTAATAAAAAPTAATAALAWLPRLCPSTASWPCR